MFHEGYYRPVCFLVVPKLEPAGGFGGGVFLGFLASRFDFCPLAMILSYMGCLITMSASNGNVT